MNYLNSQQLLQMYKFNDRINYFNDVFKSSPCLGRVRYVIVNPVLGIEPSIFRTVIVMLHEGNVYKLTPYINPKMFNNPLKLSESLIISSYTSHKILYYYIDELALNAYKDLNVNVEDFDVDDYEVVLKITDVHEYNIY